MPKSCLSVFPHCERKRQNNPFQIRTFHFHPFFSSLCLRFTVSSLPTFFPKQVYLYGVLWVAMVPLHRKRPRQFVSPYSFERVAVLGHIILLLSPGLHSWHALRLRSGCSGPPGYTMLYTRLPLVSTCLHLSPTCLLLTCISHDVPGVPQQHPPSSTGQAETRNNDQAKRETSCSKHPPAAPALRREQEECESTNQRYQRATKEGQGRGKDQEI